MQMSYQIIVTQFGNMLGNLLGILDKAVLAETMKVEIIWQPNDIWTQIDRVLIVARDGDEHLWEYEIERRAGAKLYIVPTPTPPSDPEGHDLVKPKTTPVEKPNEV